MMLDRREKTLDYCRSSAVFRRFFITLLSATAQVAVKYQIYFFEQ